VWAVVPACWNHTFSAPCSSKEIIQFRPEKVI
jgi:hypothetical protein